MSIELFDTVIIVLFFALAVTLIFRHLKLPIILGYLIVGILLGQPIARWIPDMDAVRELAEFGVVFLLFTIGLEFSLPKLTTIPARVVGLGISQILVSIVFVTGAAFWLGVPFPGAIVISGIVALSSTAIVMKQLTEQREIKTLHGSNTIAILLIQDLAAIPFMMLIPSLATNHTTTMTLAVLWALGKGIVAIFFILALGRWILRPLFRRVVAMRSIELFTLTTLLVTLSAAWLTNELGLSLAFGAFLAGMMLGETEYREKIEAEIRPFRDILLGLFFVTIGMQFHPPTLLSSWEWIALAVTSLIAFKIILITLLGMLLKNGTAKSLQTGLILAQGSEFGFVILILATNYHLISHPLSQIILSTLLFSMLLSPLLIQYNKTITHYLVRSAS